MAHEFIIVRAAGGDGRAPRGDGKESSPGKTLEVGCRAVTRSEAAGPSETGLSEVADTCSEVGAGRKVTVKSSRRSRRC